MNKKSLGRLGEKLAAFYLNLKLYKILARNFRTKYGELDIVAKKWKTIVFVEVKTRKNEKFGLEEAVNDVKQKHIAAAASNYAQKFNFIDCNMRFDVIIINLASLPFIKHYKNAFQVNEF